jgi:hypothetical protein
MPKIFEKINKEQYPSQFLKRIEDMHGPIDYENDFFSPDLKTYFKTEYIDKETGRVSHKLIKLPNLTEVYKKIQQALNSLRSLNKSQEINDENIRKIEQELNNLFNSYRTHLRKNYPEQYDLLRKSIKELSSTGGGTGAATFQPGTGMQYSTPYAFKKPSSSKFKLKQKTKSVNETEDNMNKNKKNIYISNLKYKLVPKKIKNSGLEVKHLFQEEIAQSSEDFQQQRINVFDTIEQELNEIYKMLSNAKNSTSEYYNENPGSYGVVYPTDLILDYIKDIKTLLKEE